MKIAVIGTINKDLILPFDGSPIQSIGGIYYSIAALSQMSGELVNLFPVSFLGADFYHHFLAILNRYPNVNPAGLIPIDQKNHEVILEYVSPEERTEKTIFNFPSLQWEHIRPFTDSDFFVVNLITGWDVSQEAFLKLSEKHFDKIYLDVHFLVMGTDKMGKRFPQRPDGVEKWLQGARFVQMNEKEFRIIAGKNMNGRNFYEKYFNPDQVLIITRGGDGANLFYHEDNFIRHNHVPAYGLDSIADTTGCGDVFGAGFVWRYLTSGHILESVDAANRLAAANCLIHGTNEMDKLLFFFSQLGRRNQ